MSHINFEIPVVVSGLLEENCEHYYVKEVVNAKRIPGKLEEASQLFKEDGVEYIIDYFDTYVSVILNITQLNRDIQITAFDHLHQAMKELNRSITFLLSDKESLSEEVKLKYLTIVKMLVFAYVNITIAVNNKDPSNTAYKKGKSESRSLIHKNDVLHQINKILEQEINIFWDPPVVEESLINQIAEVCYNFIETNASIKSDKTQCEDIFNLFGTLLTSYRYGTRFVYRIAELVKSYEHSVTIVSGGIKLLVESYNAKSLVREFVRQITEWQTDEKYQNAQATRNCAHVLSEMAKSMPEFMLKEVMYLTDYLNHESYNLRISVINVLTEVMLTSLGKDLNADKAESRNEFFEILLEHLNDVSAFVRARVIQNWSRLQKENMLPKEMHATILKNIIQHLRDKASNVRKVAANCVTSFLEHNPFGSELRLKDAEETIAKQKQLYEEMAKEHCEPEFQNLKKSEEEWESMKDDVMKIIENNLNDENSEHSKDEEDSDTPTDGVPVIVKSYLKEKKYKEAVKITKNAVDQIEELSNLRHTIEHQNEGEFLLKLMRNFYIDFQHLLLITDDDNEGVQNLKEQQKLIEYQESAIHFIKVLESSIVAMKDLLESVNISEMQEAVEFFIATYKFKIDNALQGILEMLHIMQRPEQDRRVAVTNALKVIFLETSATSMQEHRKLVVDGLINFMEIITFNKVDSFKLVIYNWVSEGKLDNNIIECVFQYFIKKQDVGDNVSLKALQLLILIVPGKKSIVTKNIRIISELIFEKPIDDMIIFSETCKLLTAGTAEHQLVTDKKPPFKLKPSDPIWTHIANILCEHFDNDKIPFYNAAIKNAIRLIYVLCSKPDEVCERILEVVLKKTGLSNTESSKDIPCFILIRLCILLGELAICQFTFLDETIYKEIKRRFYIAAEFANKSKKTRGKNKDISTASMSRKTASASAQISVSEDGDDSILEGAQADDAEADFILDVLEHKTVTSATSLGCFAPLIVRICENPNTYDDEHLQCVAVLALLRYMLVSSKFCASYVRLVFTILEKTKYSEVKCTILINLSDLLERFPNIIEPWSIHMYNSLNDKELKVQKTAFYILANLLLRDMLRIKSHIAFMAMFISQENGDMSNMSRNFFNALSVKDNHLYNVLPDIFSHLIGIKDIDEDGFRFTMKYLINLISSAKHTESLVDRFCIKFMGTEDPYVCRNVSYCLSLLQYNEKAVKKFLENFNLYKHILHISDVYTLIKQTINSWAKLVKTDVKGLVAELEEKINKVFQVNEDEEGDPNSEKPVQPKPVVFKTPKAKTVRRNKKRIISRRGSDSDDEDYNLSVTPNSTAARRANESTRQTRRTPKQ